MGRGVHSRCPPKSCHSKWSPWNLGDVLPFKMRPVKIIIKCIYKEDLERALFPRCPRQAFIPPITVCLLTQCKDLRSSLLPACLPLLQTGCSAFLVLMNETDPCSLKTETNQTKDYGSETQISPILILCKDPSSLPLHVSKSRVVICNST